MLRSLIRLPWATAMPIVIASASTPLDLPAVASARRRRSDMRRPRHDDARRGKEEQQRRRQHQRPRHAKNLIAANPDEAPANPGEHQEDQERFREKPDGPEPRGAGPGPGAEKQQRAQK